MAILPGSGFEEHIWWYPVSVSLGSIAYCGPDPLMGSFDLTPLCPTQIIFIHVLLSTLHSPSHFHPSALGACPSGEPVCSPHTPITAAAQQAFPIFSTFSCLSYLTELTTWNDPASCFRNLDFSLLLGGVQAFSPQGAHITGPGGRRAEPMNTLIIGIQDSTMPAQEKGNERSLHLNAAAQFSSTGAFSY